jgi:hypothetical protein
MEAVGPGALLSFAPAVADGGRARCAAASAPWPEWPRAFRRRGIARERLAADDTSFSTSAVKAPQWASCGKRATVMPVHPVSEGLKMSLLRLRLNHVVFDIRTVRGVALRENDL